MEVQVLEEGKIFDPQEFLDGLSQQWKQDPSNTPQTSTEPFMNPPPPTETIHKNDLKIVAAKKY